MRDMTRDEVQDLLPELLHGRLSADETAGLERAVAADPDLADELALLRAVHASSRAPAIDTARIVAALPTPTGITARTPVVDELALRRETKRPMISTRFARAAALLVVVGGGTMVSIWSGRSPAITPVTQPVAAESLVVGATAMQLGLGASTDELTVEQLRALEADIRALDGIPSAELESGSDLLAGEGA